MKYDKLTRYAIKHLNGYDYLPIPRTERERYYVRQYHRLQVEILNLLDNEQRHYVIHLSLNSKLKELTNG